MFAWQKTWDTNVNIRFDISSTVHHNTFLSEYKYSYIFSDKLRLILNLTKLFIFLIAFAYTLYTILDPTVHSTDWFYLLPMYVGLKMVLRKTETCSYSKIPVSYTVLFWRNKLLVFIMSRLHYCTVCLSTFKSNWKFDIILFTVMHVISIATE